MEELDRPLLPVSVIICARNRESTLARCLQTVEATSPAEVIVIDGVSKDRTVEVAAAAGYRVVSDGGAGLGAARQLGAELATKPYVAFVDSDVSLAPGTLRILLDEAEENGWDAVQARILGPTNRQSYWQRGEQWRRMVQERPGPAAALGCLATVVRRDLIREVRFDPAFSGASEDGDFFFRAREAGATIGLSYRAVAYHEDRGGFWGFGRQRIWHGQGIARIMVRHRRPFRSSATTRMATVRHGISRDVRYLPFMAASVAFLSIGVAVESLRIAFDRRLAARLRHPPGRRANRGRDAQRSDSPYRAGIRSRTAG
jgi:glycosyltransferase involved in cell wall biosynthesis